MYVQLYVYMSCMYVYMYRYVYMNVMYIHVHVQDRVFVYPGTQQFQKFIFAKNPEKTQLNAQLKIARHCAIYLSRPANLSKSF